MDNETGAGTIEVMLHQRPPHRFGDDRDNVVVLHGVAWSTYEALLLEREKSDRRQPRYAYLDGELEAMTTSARHELTKTLIARLLCVYSLETEIDITGVGSATLRDEQKEAGLEPDEWFCVGAYKDIADLAIEVVYTSGGIEKLEIYRRLGIREVWFWIDGCFWLDRLVKGQYKRIEKSRLLPGFDLDEVARIVLTTKDSDHATACRAYQKRLKRRR